MTTKMYVCVLSLSAISALAAIAFASIVVEAVLDTVALRSQSDAGTWTCEGDECPQLDEIVSYNVQKIDWQDGDRACALCEGGCPKWDNRPTFGVGADEWESLTFGFPDGKVYTLGEMRRCVEVQQ